MRSEIESEIKKIYNKYLVSAEEIVSGYERENTLSKDYEGRQMFELLQNADDESCGSEGKVLVKFDGSKLSISNTGMPFSFRGIKSLLYPNASPKKIHANKIGCKGLGFRSILTWATQVTVATQEFTVQFSQDYARKFLGKIIDENPDLSDEIKNLSKEQYPIATLTCPKIVEEQALVEGFVTTIIIDCKQNLSNDIESQIKSLEFEELVFLPNLKEVEIICKEDYHKVFFKVVQDNEVSIEVEDKLTGVRKSADWILYRTSGIVIDENEKDRDYEFIVAYDPSGKHTSEVLYSYFKTDVKLAFPALIHGTFELTSDRNSLQKGSLVNKKLIDLLSDFLVETAVKISESNEECSYNPLRLVIASDMDIVLSQTFGLDQKLKDKAKEKRILPTIAGTYTSVNENPRFSGLDFEKWLAPEPFHALLKYTSDDKIVDYITDELGIEFYEYEEFCGLINAGLDYYNVAAKVKLIKLIEDEFSYRKSSSVFPQLLIDNEGNNIIDNSKVYPLPNEEDEVVELPRWVDVKYLNSDMEQRICKELGISKDKRTLARRLSRYNADEYSFDRLLRSVVNQYDSIIVTEDKCNDILNWLWNYYIKEDRQAIPDVKVKVMCRDGEIRYAKECYLGADFGNTLGERITSIFSSNFVSPKEMKLKTNDINEIADFLVWIGVSKFPRLISVELPYEQRVSYVKSHSSIYSTRDYCYYSYSDFQSIVKVVVGVFEAFDSIIEQADFNDILCWIILDEKFNKLISASNEESNVFSQIVAYPNFKRDSRTFSSKYMKSYLRYLLSSVKWIPNIDGIKEDASHSCFEDNGLTPFIIVPNVDYAYIKNVVGRNCKKDVDLILSNIGVSDVFQELDKTVIYEALKRLPQLDIEGKKGKSIYRKLIREIDSVDSVTFNNDAYTDFIKTGSVLAKTSMGKKYIPIGEVRYADKKVFSDKILKNFNMFDVDSRSGEEKIRKLFGVVPLKYVNAEIDGDPIIHKLDGAFVDEYHKFLPFVYVCRMGLKNENQDFNRLKSTKIMLCSDVSIKYDFDGDTTTCKLEKFETVYLRKKNAAYIQVPTEHTIISELIKDFDFADAVSELITVILDVNEDKDFYRDLFRENTFIREKKMRVDKNDENLELLNAARRKFKAEINLREEFWMTLSAIMRINISDEPNSDDMIDALGFDKGVDNGINFDNINEYAEFIIKVFRALKIDIPAYNNQSVHTINIVDYWRKLLMDKAKIYKNKYLANIYETIRDEDDSISQYEEYCNNYDSSQYDIDNSVNVDIDAVFEAEHGISFGELDEYDDSVISHLIDERSQKVASDDMEFLNANYSRSTVHAHLLFDRIDELVISKISNSDLQGEIHVNDKPKAPSIYDLIESAFSTETVGVSAISTKIKQQVAINSGNRIAGNHQGRIYSEQTEKNKKENGMTGEIAVFKELMHLYPETTHWVSGNAQQANRIEKGDDSCGYDMYYIDADGVKQYVEVKASKSEEITFSLSDNELKFALSHSKNYEIFYVVIGDNGKPKHEIWRLGHLFDFSEDEELMRNDRFTIESKEYCITAKPIQK